MSLIRFIATLHLGHFIMLSSNLSSDLARRWTQSFSISSMLPSEIGPL